VKHDRQKENRVLPYPLDRSSFMLKAGTEKITWGLEGVFCILGRRWTYLFFSFVFFKSIEISIYSATWSIL